MEFKWHILFGFLFSYVLVYFFDFSLFAGVIIFFASWVIDCDHYFWYAFETGDRNPINAIKWYIKSVPKWCRLSFKEKGKFKQGVFIFHGLFFWIILALLSFVHSFFLWILIGVGIHMVADLMDLRIRGKPLYGKIFPCYVIKKNKNKKGLVGL